MEMELRFPRWGDMSEGKILEWRKHEQDAVTEHEPLVQIELAKANVEVEAPASGTLSRILAAEGTVIHTGDVIAMIAVPD